jgi:hypothetical protein
MNILNCAHPLSAAQCAEIARMAGREINEVIDLRVQFDTNVPFVEQVVALLDSSGVSTERLQSESWLLVPPSLNFITAILLAELHGRMGHFPAIVRLRPDTSGPVTTYAIAEIVDLDRVRQVARTRR